MKLRSITLDNVRQFTTPVRLAPIGDGVVLLAEPNEAGKSTVFDALHALFYQPHRSFKAPLKALQPHSGGTVAVECELEHDGAIWRLRKQWGSSEKAKQARLWREGVLVHQDVAVEDWLAALTTGEAGGPGGLLWVRQGRVTLAAPGKEEVPEVNARRSLMNAVSGEMDAVTGGERMERAQAEVTRALDEIMSKVGPRKHGPLGRALDAVASLEAQAEAQEAAVTALRDALDARRRSRKALDALDDPDARAARQVEMQAVVAAHEAARTHANRIDALGQAAELARLSFVAARDAMDGRRKRAKAFAQAEDALAEAVAFSDTARDEAAKAQASWQQSKAEFDASQDTFRRSEAELARINRLADARRAQVRRAELTDLIARAETAAEDARAAMVEASKGPSKDTLAKLDAAQARYERARVARDAAAPRIRIAYDEGARRATLNDEDVAPDEAIALAPGALLQLPGIGTLSVDGHSQTDDLAEAERAFAEMLASAGFADIAEARRAYADADRAATAAQGAKALLAGLAPRGIDALRDALAKLPDPPPDERPQLDRAVQEGVVLAARDAAIKAAGALEAAAGLRDRARDTATTAAERLRGAAGAVERCKADLSADPPEAQLLEAFETAGAKHGTANAAYEDAARDAPDVARLAQRVARLQRSEEERTKERTTHIERIARLSGEIDKTAEEGIEEALAETLARLETARQQLVRVEFERDTLTALKAALDTAQAQARDAYFAPVARELMPLLGTLWPDAQIVWDDTSLLPETLRRAGQEEPIGTLSGGTQEQIALMVRLAFAALLAKAGRPAPLILDDALVYSDDDRIADLFDTLHAAGTDHQLIVLTCRQRAFRDLGAQRLAFEPVNV